MKNILIALALITVSATCFATSIDKTAVIATVTGQQEGISQIALLADGRLQVVNNQKKVTTLQLTQSALNQLVILAEGLSNAEVKTEDHIAVCQMMMLPSLSNLSVSGFDYEKSVFVGTPRMIMTAGGCSISHTVLPVEEYAINDASALRTAMVVLAFNTLKK